MSATLNYGLLYNGGLAVLSKQSRLPVLVALILHANERGRAWPSIETLCKETGLSAPTVINARKWLEKHGAVEIVPHDQRIGDEKTKRDGTDKEARSLVYQITGAVYVDGVRVSYLYVNNESPGAAKFQDLELQGVEHKLVPENTGDKQYPVPPAADDGSDEPEETEQQTPTRPPKQRPRDPFYDSVRETMFGDVPDGGVGGRVGLVMKSIREYEGQQGRVLDGEQLGAKVRRFWVWYRKDFPKGSLKSPDTVREWWAKFDAVKPPAPPKKLTLSPEEDKPWIPTGETQDEYYARRAQEELERRKRKVLEDLRNRGVDVSKYEND